MINQFLNGVRAYGDAHSFILKHRLWGYILAPGILSIILFVVLFIGAWHYTTALSAWLTDFTGLEGDSATAPWYQSLFKYAIEISLWLLSALLYITTFKYIVLFLMSPLLALLSEKTDSLITGTNEHFNLKQFVKDTARGMLLATRNFIIEVLISLLLWLVSFIPVAGFLSTVLIILVQSYFIGFSMIDYTSERRKLGIRDSIRYVRNHRGLAVGNGLVFYLLFLVPVLGWMVAPAYGVVAATLAVTKLPSVPLQR